MNVTTPSQLAAAFRSRRLELGLTQTEVASSVGMTQKTVSEFETRPEERSMRTVFRLMTALGLELGVSPRPSAGDKDDQDAW